ncbi:MAG TPA: FHA domain-containing protein [Pyrinomonadaceae bacterium]|nr:FHA domain-containing protein [Pyrinomonadaceae bacterium]
MNFALLALALQEEADNSMYFIIAAVLVVLFFIVVIIGVALTIFFIARKRKAQQPSGVPEISVSTGPGSAAYQVASQDVSAFPAEPETSFPNAPGVSAPAADLATPFEAEPAAHREETTDFDPTKTVAIIREPKAISYGSIKFVSGVLAGQEFEVTAAGSFIGRDESLSQIVVADPRISKRHLWIGVRDSAVTIVDQDSRNGTFVNDPRSDRVTEATLNSGDTVIMGESDVARFEYLANTLNA